MSQQQQHGNVIAPYGVGSVLHANLAAWGFKEREGCKCKEYADRMNRRGPDWCERNLDRICGWLRESAQKRRLPFSRFIAKRFIREAIAQYREDVGDVLNTFNEVYCVNLNRRRDRWQQFANQVPGNWPFRPILRWAAIDGQKFRLPTWWRQGAGAWGCYRSHLSILEHAINRGVNSILFLEDDAQFLKGFVENARQFLGQLPNDWGMVYLGGQHLKQSVQSPKKVCEGVYQPFNVNRTHAFAVRGEMRHVVYQHLYMMGVQGHNHIDHYLGRLHEKRKHPIYCPPEWIVGQAGGRSNIAGRKFPKRQWASAESIAEVDPNEEPFVAIVGLHSSGSSVIAGVIHHLGVHLGNNLTGFYGNDPDKSCGFEAVGLRDICESAVPFPETEYAMKRGAIWTKLRVWINQRRREAAKRGTIAGGKYPMLCAFPNQLRNICGDKLKVVDCGRPLEESVESLVRRCPKRDPDKLRAHQQFLWDKKGELLAEVESLTVNYADLLAEPRREIERIASYLGIDPTEEQIAKAAAYVDPSKRHIVQEATT